MEYPSYAWQTGKGYMPLYVWSGEMRSTRRRPTIWH